MSDDHADLLAEAAFEGLAVHDCGTILVANRVLATLLGHPPSDLVGKNIVDFAALECRRRFTAAIGGSDAAPAEITFLHADGHRFATEVRCSSVPRDGRVVHTIALRDVSRRTAVEDALRHSQVHLETAQAQVGMGSWEFFPEPQSASWSTGLFRLFGLDSSAGEPTLEEFVELIHPDDRERVRTSQADGLAGRPSTVEFRTDPAVGAERHMSAKVLAMRDAEGRISHLVGTVLDITERKLAREALQDGEARYRQLFESAPIGIGLADAEGRLIEFNDAMLAPGGFRREDTSAIGNVRDLYADSHARDEALNLVRRHGFLQQHEVQFKRRDGCTYDAALSLAPVTIGGEQYTLAMVEDISQRKAAQRALQESEARFRALIENSFDVTTMVGPDGTVLYTSPSVKRVLGYEPDELIGRIGDELLHPDDVSGAHAAFAQALSQPGAVMHMTHRLRHADGAYRTVQVTGTNLLDEPGVNAIVSNLRDVTSQRRAEAELRHSEAKYRAVFEQAAFGIFQAAPDGSFLTVNRALVELLGYETTDEVLGLDVETDVYDDPDQWDRVMRECEETGAAAVAEVRWRRKGDSVITVRLSGRRIVDGNGGVAGFEMIAEDVTHQQALERQLRHAQKMEAIGQLTAGIAHDFNNLLTAVLGRAELLDEHLPPEYGGLHDDVDEIRVAAIRGADMVKKLLAFSREEGLRFDTMDLARLCDETIRMLKGMLPETMEIVMQTENETCWVRADRGAIQQILVNLTTNGCDAMPFGGTMTVTVETVRTARAFDAAPDWNQADTYVCLSVSDTGLGMDPVTQERIFDPFFTTKPVGEGTGLGMSMVYGTVKQHHGHIQVESAPGKGTTVSVYFPAATAPAAGAASPAAASPRGGVETILMVEDDAAIRRVGARVLEEAGYRVRVACDGEEALEMLGTEGGTIDLIITDVVMPRLGGRELHERARALGCGAPFVFTSGYSDVTHGMAEQDAQTVTLLVKPWSTMELKRCVRQALDRRAVS